MDITERQLSALEWSIQALKGLLYLPVLVKKKKTTTTLKATTMPFLWSLKDCASLLCLHLHYICAIPFTVPF